MLRSKYLRIEERFLREDVEDAIRESIIKFNEILDSEDLRGNQDFDTVVVNQIVGHQLLGQGGFAKVYFVHQTKSVIKILNIWRKDDSAITRFRREYEMEYCEMTLEKYKSKEK